MSVKTHQRYVLVDVSRSLATVYAASVTHLPLSQPRSSQAARRQPASRRDIQAEASLIDELKKKDVKLVKPGVFFDCWEQQKLLPRCQDVLPQFVVDINALTDEEPRTLEVLAISHCWVDKAHPDPLMYHLETVYHTLKKFTAGTYDKVRFYNSNGVKFVANGTESARRWRRPTSGHLPGLVERSAGNALRERQGSGQACAWQHQSVVRPPFDDHMDVDVFAARCHPRGLRCK